jgi:plasmid maintenance system antidote protein VapI
MKTENFIERIIRDELAKIKTSRRQIAIKTGVKGSIVCHFMQGTRGLSTDSAAALLEYFGYRITKGKGAGK